jgi:hypothetical protein
MAWSRCKTRQGRKKDAYVSLLPNFTGFAVYFSRLLVPTSRKSRLRSAKP